MTKALGIGLIIVAALLVTQFFDLGSKILRTPAQTLTSQIQTDIEKKLIQAGIPRSNGLHHTDIKFRSQIAHDLLQNDRPRFATSNDGKIWIEIEILDLPDNDAPGFITQTSVFEVKTNNKISEFGQTYDLKSYGLFAKKEERTSKRSKK